MEFFRLTNVILCSSDDIQIYTQHPVLSCAMQGLGFRCGLVWGVRLGGIFRVQGDILQFSLIFVIKHPFMDSFGASSMLLAKH